MAIFLDRAREVVLADAAPLPAESVPVAAAAGRVLAGELTARIDAPPDTNSAMDGFAVTAGTGGRTLRLVGESRAGSPSPAEVDSGTAVRVATGGVLPPGAEAVVAQERASLAGGLVTVREACGRGANVREAGEDMRAGQTILRAGTRLGAPELMVAIGAGHGELLCHRRPLITLLGTGEELREPGSRLARGEIHDSNTIALAALARQAGATVVRRGRVGDDPAALRRELLQAFGESDVVVISGGVSVGPHDHVKATLVGLETEERFWGVKIRPGRPTWFGRRGDVLALGLPGNPVSALVAFILLARPLLAMLQGTTGLPAPTRARLTSPLTRHPERISAVGVRLDATEDEGLAAAPTARLGSHLTTSLLGVDGLALVPAGRGELPAGSVVDVERL